MGTLGKYAAEVNRVIEAWAESTIDEKLRKHSLAFELAQHAEAKRTGVVQKAIEQAGLKTGVYVA
jgi:hypothetical protein